MNEDINLYETLIGCPTGTPLYSSVLGDVNLFKVEKTKITVSKYDGLFYYRVNGHFYSYGDSECTLFPSREQRDWSKFKVPIKRFNPKEFKTFDRVLGRIDSGSDWGIDFFERLVGERAGCISGCWNQCIPYNDDTKSFLGTSSACPEYYRWWERSWQVQ